ncbi:MAG: hypothetical protein ACRDIB_08475, partial [Ardenticatenaceae bacterium]
GHTYSTTFPTTPGAYDTEYNGGLTDAFVATVAPMGATLAYSTYLGGNDFDDGEGVDVVSGEGAYITGRTNSLNFPVTPGAYDGVYNGGRDAFVVKMVTDGRDVSYGTYLGGGGEEETGGIAVGSAGQAFVIGYTTSEDFPTTPGAYDTTHNGNYDLFLAELAPPGDALVYGTYAGGPGADYGRGIELDVEDAVYGAGYGGLVNTAAFAFKIEPNSEPPTSVEVDRFSSEPGVNQPSLLALLLLLGVGLAGLVGITYRRACGTS